MKQMNGDTVTTVSVWRSPIITMKECTCYPAAALTCKYTLTVEPLQFHNYSGSSVITKEAFPTLSVLFTVGAVNRMSFLGGQEGKCLTLPATK